MSEPTNPHDEIHKRAFIRGQKAEADAKASEQFIERMQATQEALRAAGETIDLANQMAKDGDDHKRLIAELIKDTVAKAATQVAAGEPADVVGRRGAVEASPFFNDSSTASQTSEPNSLNSPATRPALPEPAPAKKRGRPPGSKNRSKS